MSAAAPSVVLAGGGTAGHVSPLLAIADAIRLREPAASLMAVGTNTGLETRLVPAAGYELATISRVPLPRRPSLDLLRLPGRLSGAVRAAGRILDQQNASVLVGVGGYVCTPAYIAARRRGIPIVVHEANARPGLANRVGARWAHTVAIAFEGTRLPGAQWVGMPMPKAISGLDRSKERAAARAALGLALDQPTVIVTGGSSGAVNLNRTIAASLDSLTAAGIQVLHITGGGKATRDASGQLLTTENYRQVEYVDGMHNVYAAADLLIARAGAATVSEVSAVGLASVLVPLPHGNGEQARNAAGLAAAGGTIVIDDAGFTPSWVAQNIPPLFLRDGELAAMDRRAASLGIRDADQRMAELVLSAAGARQ